MIVIRPTEINDGNLTDTNVSESGVQPWLFDKSYEIGARVVKQYTSELSTRITPSSTNYRAMAFGNGVWIALQSGSTNVIRSTDNGVNWSEAATGAEANAWVGLVYDGSGTWVAVSSGGTNRAMYSTDDGVSWTSSTPTANPFRDIAFGAGLFVAVSTTGGFRVQTSPDGITWSSRSITLNDWRGIAWSESQSLFVVIASSGVGNRVHTSPDGITWTTRTSAADVFWNCVAFGDGEFIALAASATGAKVMTSPDGFTWTQRDDFAGYNIWQSIVFGNGEFMAVSSAGGPLAMSSRDKGVTWQAVDAGETGYYVIDYGNDTFLTVGSFVEIRASKGVHSIYESTSDSNIGNWPDEDDLITPVNWARVSATNRWAMFSDQLSDQTSKSSTFEVSIKPGVEVDSCAFFNVDAETIQVIVRDFNFGGTIWTPRVDAASNSWTASVFGNDLFVAVSNTGAGNRVMTSADGVNWTIRESAEDLNWRGLAYGAGLYVAVALTGSGRVMTSPDGINWTSRSASVDNNWAGLTFGGGLFVAVAASGTGDRVMTSSDGISWTTRTSAADDDWVAVTYDGTNYIAVSSDGTVMTSPTGVTWTTRTAASSNEWRAITSGGGTVVAVASTGTGDRAMYSTDSGVTWTSSNTLASNNWKGITYGNGVFVAVSDSGSGNRAVTSFDGITWVVQTTPSNSWWSVSYGKNLFAAVAYDGTNRVMTAEDGGISYSTVFTLEENFLEPGVRQDTLAVLDLPVGHPNSTISASFVDSTGGTKCGRMTIGSQQLFGDTNSGSSIGIVDFSKKERDTFGNPVIVQRNFAKRGNFTTTIDTINVSAIAQTLGNLRTTPSAYIASENIPSSIIYGFYKDFDITLQPNKSTLTMEIEGLT